MKIGPTAKGHEAFLERREFVRRMGLGALAVAAAPHGPVGR